jgi:hypothetical protein
VTVVGINVRSCERRGNVVQRPPGRRRVSGIGRRTTPLTLPVG